MDFDLEPHFKRYEALVEKVEQVFDVMKKKYPAEVRCKASCDDCCHALFDLTLIEAMCVNHHFNKRFSGTEKVRMLEKANKADRKVYKIKKAAFKSEQKGEDVEKIISDVAKERVQCPLLSNDKLCEMYEYRPIACRVYGIPVAVGGKGRTCGFSGFKSGEKYPTFNHDVIHDQLLSISADVLNEIRSKFIQMVDILVPVSMALLTEYDDDYFGLSGKNELSEKDKTSV